MRAFDFWAELPLLEPVTVAVIDTGIDLGHPDLTNNVVAAKSFVGGSADDPIGHGTFVAGLIAAEVNNAEGVAGMAFPARLLVARVATADGDIDAAVEAKAIRWAVNRGARVINLSIGGDPRSAAPHPRHVLAGGGGCRRLCAQQGRRRRGVRRQRRLCAVEAVAVCELSRRVCPT